MNFEELRKRIRERRKFLGMTQEELADKVDISTMSIRRYESGERLPKHETVEKIAKALQCDISELISPKEEGQLIIQNLIDSLEELSDENEKAQQAAEEAVKGDYLVFLANFLIQNSEEISLLKSKGYRIEITSKIGAVIQDGFVKTVMTTSALVNKITAFSKAFDSLLENFQASKQPNSETEENDDAPQDNP